ncbi:UNVERIFIED_CONTAM: hypothetical protein FKN15_056822 [Acipenser sinensis]
MDNVSLVDNRQEVEERQRKERKVCYQRMDRMISQDSLHPPSFSRFVSQESLDSASIDDYWSEVKSIEESAENGQDQHAVLEVKSADEGELEEAWFQEAGLSTLMSGSPGEEPAEALFSTLTRMQAAVVKKRIDNYTQTQRKKKPVRDVRDIFAVEDSPTHRAAASELQCRRTAGWFQEAGLSTLMSGSPGEEPAEALFSTLTRMQAAVVKKRIDNYTQTQRKKKPVRDVRDIFAVEDSPDIHDLSLLCVYYMESCASDCKPSKDSPSLPEELNFDVPYSECALRKDCRSIQRIKKDDATLPKFMIRKAKLGLTVVGDLSQEDMKKIGYISLIELTAYFEALGIELKRNRTVKSKVREYGLFGVPLTTLLENDQKKFPGSKVPLIFKKLLSKLEQTGLQTEGILRVPGSASRVKNLRQELEAKFYEDTFEWDQVRHNDAAGLLKMFIRELPYPLLTVEYLPAFIAVENISPSKLQLQALHLLMMLLPEPNRDTLKDIHDLSLLCVYYMESCASDCKPSKDSPSLPEELNFDVPYSECALRKDCRSIQRIKKDDATLPKFMIRKAKLGLTVVGDLSQEDMKKIGYISLIELTAYFEALGIELKRNRTVKSKVREYGLFGVPLTTLLENDQKKFPGSKVPLIFKKLLSKLEQTGLQTEGILRVPGSASRVKNLRQELEAKFYEDTFEWDQVRHNDAAGLLKMFIRELPYPLLTVEYLPAFIAVEIFKDNFLYLSRI